MFRFYSKSGGPRATLVGTHVNGVLKIAAARCSEKDNFSKSKGVEIASSRLNRNHTIYEEEMAECSAKDFVLRAHILEQPVVRAKAVNSHK